MEQDSDNPLLSDKPSDSGTTVSLHPLVLLTASDQITRHRVRGDSQPVVGILLGQQKGRELTAEHAFAAALQKSDDGKYEFDQEWLDQRTQQYRDVHKAPALDVVGWYALVPTTGPVPELTPFQRYMTGLNETNILLAIHPTAFERSDSADQKLPVTIYESIIESNPAKDDNSMQVDGEESSDLKFRPVPYSIDTDEAEMIAINFVSKGAGSAAAVAETEPANAATPDPPAEDRKGKKRASPEASQPKPHSPTDLEILSTEEQDQIANLTTRLNSVKMLQSRLAQLHAFVASLPSSYLSDSNIPLTPDSPDPNHLSHLRNIQALLTRLSLLTPPSSSSGSETGLEAASRAQRNDVNLTQLLTVLNKDVQGLQELGKTFSIVEQARASKRKTGGGGGFDSGMISDMATPFQGPGGRSMLV